MVGDKNYKLALRVLCCTVTDHLSCVFLIFIQSIIQGCLHLLDDNCILTCRVYFLTLTGVNGDKFSKEDEPVCSLFFITLGILLAAAAVSN